MMQGVIQPDIIQNNFTTVGFGQVNGDLFCIRRSKRRFIQLVLVLLPAEFQAQVKRLQTQKVEIDAEVQSCPL